MGCCRRHAQPQMALSWWGLVVSELQALPAHKGGLGTHFLQPRQPSPWVCSKSGLLSNCVAVGTSMASGLNLAVSGSHPVRSSPNRKTLLLPPSVIGWGSILLRPTMQVLPGSSCLKHFPYGLQPIPLVFCFLPPHAHLAFQIQLCPEDDNLTHPSHSRGTTPAACSAFKIQVICSSSIRRV